MDRWVEKLIRSAPWVGVRHLYSYLSASMGSIFAAFQAG